MLQSQESEALVTCRRATYNGSTMLVFFTSGCTPLAQFAQEASLEDVCRALRGLVDAIVSVRGNGFLSDRNLLLDLPDVFVDPTSGDIRLMYTPFVVSGSRASDAQVGRRAVATCDAAVSLAVGVPSGALRLPVRARERGDLDALREELFRVPRRSYAKPASDPAPAGPVGRHAARAGAPQGAGTVASGSPASAPRHLGCEYVLTARGDATAVYRITGRTVLGKSGGRADCVITGSSAISRAHCELNVTPAGALTVKDLKSLNGTFVNGMRLDPGVETPVEPGSTLKLADVAFSVAKAGR